MSILSKINAFYKMDESSGNALDGVASNNLTAVASPGTAAGKVGTSRDLVAASAQYFSIADNATFSAGDVHITIALWVYLNSKPGAMSIVSKWNTSSQREYELLYFNTPDRFQFIVSTDGTTVAATAQADNLGSPSTGAWIFLVAQHDPISNQVRIRGNNGTVNNTSHTGGVRDGTSNWRIGSRSTTGVHLNGRVDEVLFAKAQFSDFELTWLYNSGSGRSFDDFGLVGSFWPTSATDDGTSGTGSGYNNNGSGVRVGGYFGTANFWIRFPSTDIPEGATIVSATVTGSVTTSTGSGAKFRWYGVKQTAPTYPTDGTDFDGRPLTTNYLAQTRSGSGAYTSGSLVSVLQELVDQAGFSGTVMLYAKDDGSNATYGGSENHLVFRSTENNTDLLTLNVEWTLPTGASGSLLKGKLSRVCLVN